MNQLLITVLSCLFQLSRCAVIVIASETTPTSLRSANLFGSFGVTYRIVDIHEIFLTDSDVLETSLLIDISFADSVAAQLSYLAAELRVPIIVLRRVSAGAISEWSYYVGGSFRQMEEAIESLLGTFRFGSANLIGDLTEGSRGLREVFESGRVEYAVQIFEHEADVPRIVGKLIRKRGNRVSVFTTCPETTKKVMKAQAAMHVGGIGYANILPLTSALCSLTDTEEALADGNIIIAEEEFADVETEADFYVKQLSLVSRYFGLTGESAKDRLDRDFPTHVRSANFVVLNTSGGRRVSVGTIRNGSVEIGTNVTFLGNSTTIPRNETASIQVSGNFGNLNPSEQYLPVDIYMQGALMALRDVSTRSDILPNFHLELWNFTGGVNAFSTSKFSQSVMPHREKFGAAIFTNIASSNAIPMINYLRSVNVTTPVIGSTNTNPVLSSKSSFPNFIRTCLPDDYVNLVIVQMFNHFNWAKCGLLVVNNRLGYDAQTSFQSLFAESGIEIVNSPQYQVLDASATTLEAARANLTESLQHFIDTKARVLLVITIFISHYIPVILYDLGLRCGDVVIVGREWMTSDVLKPLDPDSYRKAQEILCGSLQLSPDRFVGNIGAQVQTEYQKLYEIDPRDYVCFYYDSMMAVGYALDWLIDSGQDFMNSTLMMHSLIDTRFTGCTGLVYFDSTTHNRNPMRYALETMTVTPTGEAMTRVGLYDPQGMVLLTINKDFDWGKGLTRIPKDMRNSTLGCPFEDRLDTAFDTGAILFIGVCVAVFLLSTIGSVYIYMRWRRTPFQVMTAHKEIQAEDVLVEFGLVVELVQSLALSPSLEFFSPFLQEFLDSLVLNSSSKGSTTEGGFAVLWIGVLSAVTLWMVSSMVFSQWCWLGRSLNRSLIETTNHAFGNWFFVPFISVLLDPFMCRRAVCQVFETPSFSSSYMDSDCYIPCWRGKHLVFAILSAFSLIFFTLGSLFIRPIWQCTQVHLNIRASISYLVVKPVVQLALVLVLKVASRSHPLVHAAVFLAIWTGYFAFCLTTRCFGYQKVRVLHILFTFAVLWTAVLSLIRIAIGDTDLSAVFTGLTVGGWALLCLAGGLYESRMPSLLHRRKGMDPNPLFKFAFKPTSDAILSELEAEFRKVGHRSRVLKDRRNEYLAEGEQECATYNHFFVVAA